MMVLTPLKTWPNRKYSLSIEWLQGRLGGGREFGKA